jgi:hypothetical protein
MRAVNAELIDRAVDIVSEPTAIFERMVTERPPLAQRAVFVHPVADIVTKVAPPMTAINKRPATIEAGIVIVTAVVPAAAVVDAELVMVGNATAHAS